jgi:FAD/FMN-containing dehydrogenase/Fe-S oxidoreductase
MDAERERIQEDLRGLLAGEVRCDDLFLQLYASDASIYEIKPLGIVRPRNVEDVAATVRYASEHQISLHARGAGTGLAGESLGRGLVVDFSRYMRRIVHTDVDSVRVQPGVVHQSLNAHLATFGRQFGPDPAMSHVTTMGSVLAIDAAGSHWLRYGSARRHARSMQVVLADGEVLEVGREPIPVGFAGNRHPRLREIVGQLAELIEKNAELIERYRPQSLVNRSGYVLDGVLENGHLDLAKLLVGSEGTLALITEATVDTQPLLLHRGVALLLFESLENASKAVMEVLALKPSACDLMDRRHLSLARESDARYDLLIPGETEAVLLVEQQHDSADEVRASLSRIVDRIRRRKRLAFGAHLAMEPEEVDLYWRLARGWGPTLHRLRGSTRPIPFVEDLAVPPEALPDFLVRLQNVLKKHLVTASLFGHAGHGQLHVRPFLDLANADDVQRMERLTEDLYREVFAVGGTISGEHGDGLSRTPYLRMQYGPLCDVFRDVKRIFDPRGILNPGKIVSHDPAPMSSHLRPVAVAAAVQSESPPVGNSPQDAAGASAALLGPVVPLQLAWELDEVTFAARSCNGCGACRSQQEDVRMCPIFHFAPREEASPRAKANLVRGVLTGALDSQLSTSDDFKQVADLCVHCHQCRLECPANVDIPKLMIEAKAAYVRTNGVKPSDRWMAGIDTVSAWAGRLPRLSNWILGNRQGRWVVEKLLGFAQGRKLPRLATRSFMRIAARKKLTRPSRRPGAKVLYFVDTYANHHDTQLAEALVRVFEHNSVAVFVHREQRPAGMALFAHGALDKARELATHNIDLLADAVRQGYHIVASEPAAVLALTREYPQLLGDDDARLVAENTSEACHYLWRMHQQGKLQLDFQPLAASLGYHQPCHLKALQIASPGENLLRLIPGLQVMHVERGCSGMAGTYGLKKENYRNSLRAGWGLISAIRELPIQAGTTECSTCKIQMEQGTSKPTIHPLKLLALAYHLMPELNGLLHRTSEELVVT